MKEFNLQFASHAKLEQLKQFILEHGTYIELKKGELFFRLYSGNSIIHWIFFKEAENREEAKDGIMTKAEYQRMKR